MVEPPRPLTASFLLILRKCMIVVVALVVCGNALWTASYYKLHTELSWWDYPMEIRTSFRQNTTAPLHKKLRFDWTNLELSSPLAIGMQQHQTNCKLELAKYWHRNAYGLGSDLHVWGQALCNAMNQGVRMRSTGSWIWRDINSCSKIQGEESSMSPMSCYFPQVEPPCPQDKQIVLQNAFAANLTSSGYIVQNACKAIMKRFKATISDVRAAATEFLFSRVSPIVQDEALRQLNRIFGNIDTIPSDLITVHIRWGDKYREMKLQPVQNYTQAVQQLLEASNRPIDQANIFLATEDPKAVQAFQSAAPDGWKIYVDAYFSEMLPHRRPGNEFNGNPRMSKALDGKPGLVALASLLVAMEANDFVLTTKSNWSRLLNELRKNIVDPRCGQCTRMIDLQPGEH